MNDFDDLIDKILKISVWDVAKLAVLLFLFLYILFSVVVIRQVKLMTQALNGSLNLPLKLIAWIHFAIALFIFFFSLFVL